MKMNTIKNNNKVEMKMSIRIKNKSRNKINYQ